MKSQYRTRFDRIYFRNRWRMKKYSRPCDWTIVGIHKRYAAWDQFEWMICFFGFELHVWLEKIKKL
jgi:hypothetical protein